MTPTPSYKGTVLIVDDEPNVLWFISKVCQPMGYETLTAGSGAEALVDLREFASKMDLVLLDLKMPGMGGIETLKAIRRDYPSLPVIVLTAAHEKQAECETLGIEAFIKKPYSLEDLYQRIEMVMKRKDEVQEPPAFQMEPGVLPCAKILIVDDDPEVCEVLSAVLFEEATDVHFEGRWVSSGEEALEVSKKFEPDIAIINIQMPRMWGDELVRRFKAGEGVCPRDFVIYTGSADPIEIERAKKLGHKHLTKPTDMDALLEALRKICMRHRLMKRVEKKQI